MLTLEERRESFVEDALPYIAGTYYGDGKRVIARTGLAMGFDQGYIFAIETACEWLDVNITCMDDETRAFFLMRFKKAMEE